MFGDVLHRGWLQFRHSLDWFLITLAKLSHYFNIERIRGSQNFFVLCKRLHKGCTCLKCTNKLEARARSAPIEFTAHSALLVQLRQLHPLSCTP
ncbi:hypothetical protein HMPREF0673_00775 [Leyella stercorea DSM 18206]|uniref:Uncharacterized protein n=1 Tax=Leyella stercorea DSM 18206 TaxID=1002367 RepID=G6AVY0_9BACT|nr:hypothetical protein HMPREF0673_00775 [Leyella stercorea DSM 18206]